jgi:two-component sensor histidine kinase
MLKQAGLDAEAQIVAARIQAVLTDEIHHRTKNMLTVVTAVVRQSIRSATSLAEAEAAIGARLIAMAKAHDLLLKADLHSGGLTMVVQGAIEQHNSAAGRILVEGPDIEVASTSILPLSLLINELCTNATKYGALSTEGGLVTLSWSRDAQDKSLIFRWVESGGPPVAPPGPKSFGTRLIESGIPRQFGGEGLLSFPSSGVEFRLTVPLDRLLP